MRLLLLLTFLTASGIASASPEDPSGADDSLWERISHGFFAIFEGESEGGTSEVAEADGYQSSDTGAFYEDAIVHLENNEIDAAVIQLRNAIKADASNLLAYLRLADLYLELHSPVSAENTLNQALNRGADRTLVVVPLAQAMLDQRKYQELLDSNTLQVTRLPHALKLKLNVMRAKGYFGLRQYGRAERVLVDVVDIAPDFVPAHIELARINLAQGNRSAARTIIDRVDASKVSRVDYWLILGELARADSDTDLAISHFNQALEMDGQHLVGLYARAGLLLDLNLTDQARKDIETIRTHFPNELRGMVMAYLLALKDKDRATANEILRQASLEIEKYDFLKLRDDPYNLLLVASISHFKTDDEQASLLFERYLELVPTNGEAMRLLASSYLRLNRAEKALSILEQAQVISAGDPRVAILLAQAHMKLGDYKKASGLFQKVSAVTTGNSQVRAQGALAKLAGGEVETALAELESLAEAPDAQESAALMFGNALMSLGQYQKALDVALRRLEQAENNALLLNLVGNAYLGLKDVRAARKNFSAALAVDSQYLLPALSLAALDVREGRLVEAEADLKKLLLIDENNREAFRLLSMIAENRGELQLATETLKKALDQGLDVKNGLRLVELYLRLGRAQDARSFIVELRTGLPVDARILAAEAKIALKNNNAEKARNIYERMKRLALEHASLPGLLNTAGYQHAMGDTKAALLTLDEADRMNPSSLMVLALRSEVEMAAAHYQQVFDIAKQMIELQPKEPIGYRLAGDALRRLNKPVDAGRWYELGLKKTENSTRLVLSYFSYLQSAQGLASAVEFLESWVGQKAPTQNGVFLSLAAAYANLGDFQKAISLNEVLYQQNNNSPAVLNNLAFLYLETGDDRALEFAERAYQLDPNSYAILDTYGWVLTQSGNPELGLPLLRNALARSANTAEIHYHYAVALHKSGRSEAALRELRKVLNENGSFPGSEDAQRLLKQWIEGAAG